LTRGQVTINRLLLDETNKLFFNQQPGQLSFPFLRV